MAELNTPKKNKICLEDYNYKQDIENRLALAQFSAFDVEILEEILYSSIKISIRKLAKSVDSDESEILPTLEKLSKTGLLTFEGDAIVVDKEMRKYFETQLLKFDPDFKPGMEFLQGLLRKVPIHILPIWYSIPRTSNNIFDSLVEKYLLTPQIFHRYLMELQSTDPLLSGIIDAVYQAPGMKVYGKDLIERFKLSKERFEEYLLLLEFHFACCLGYEKINDAWEEVVSPFHEWREYVAHVNRTVCRPVENPEEVLRYRPEDFSFVQDISHLLHLAKKQPIQLESVEARRFLPEPSVLKTLADKIKGWEKDDPAFLSYLDRLYTKVRLLKLADIVDGRLYALENANDWLDMRLENRALFLYRHPLNRLVSDQIPVDLINDRNLREAEKSIVRVLDKGWVAFDSFIKGVFIPLSEDSVIMLKKQGKAWHYTLPVYKEEELALIKETVLNWLFEAGVTAVGKYNGRDCFCVTPFGQSLYGG